MKEIDKKNILKRNIDRTVPLFVSQGFKVFSNDVNEDNQLVYVAKDADGKRRVLLYNEIDYRDIPKKPERFAKKIHKADGTVKVIESHDKNGNRVDVELEKDKFIHPEKYPKGKPLDQLIPPV